MPGLLPINQEKKYNYHENIWKKAKGTALEMAVALFCKYSIMPQKGKVKH